MKINPDEIRFAAQSISDCHEIAFSETKKVLVYLTGVSNTSSSSLIVQDSSKLARVNIYYETGTVGVNNVLNREVRENFTKKANLATVERILRNPVSGEINLNHLVNKDSEESDFKKKLELADVGIAVLVAERDKLIEHANFLGKKYNKEVRKEDGPVSHHHELKEEEEEEGYLAQEGKNFAYSLPDDTVSKVDEYLDCWEDVKCVATNGQGTVCLYESGDCQFTQGIPRFLKNKLSGRKSNQPCPLYVSIGCEGQYFVSFEDGNFEWMGCDAMRDVLMKSKKDVRTVAFGSTYETYFIVFEDGSWQFDGTIPAGLENKLSDRGDRGDLTCVSLGPNGEYFLAARNGRRWWGGVSEELSNAIAPIQDRISFMDFGMDGSFMVRYRFRRYHI